MKAFELGQRFIEQHARKASLDELKRLFAESLHAMGIRYFACCSHGDPLNPAARNLVFHNYPGEWVRSYSERCLYRIDPVFRYANQQMVGFRWDDPEFSATLSPVQRRIMMDAERYGIAHGYTVPIHAGNEHMASCSVVPESGVIDGVCLPTVFIMAHYMYEAMSRSNGREHRARPLSAQFSERERQCLELAAQGKDDWSIGSILNISERTAHNHIERAKKRLGVGTRVQVIVHALRHGQLSYGDVLRVSASNGARVHDSEHEKGLNEPQRAGLHRARAPRRSGTTRSDTA